MQISIDYFDPLSNTSFFMKSVIQKINKQKPKVRKIQDVIITKGKKILITYNRMNKRIEISNL